MKIFRRSVDIAYALFDREHDNRCFVCSFGWRRNQLLAIGINSSKTNPANILNPIRCNRTGQSIIKSGTCAELNLFKKVKNTLDIDFSELTVINIRIDKKMRLGLSKPCQSCDNLFKYCEPKKVFYTLAGEGTHFKFEEYKY